MNRTLKIVAALTVLAAPLASAETIRHYTVDTPNGQNVEAWRSTQTTTTVTTSDTDRVQGPRQNIRQMDEQKLVRRESPNGPATFFYAPLK